MKSLRSLIIVILAALCLNLAAQDVTPPLTPVLDRVTVDPVSGSALLYWLPGGSEDVACHVIYTYRNNLATAVDTLIPASLTEYTFTGSAARFRSETYVVAAMDSSDNVSPLSNDLATIYLSIVNDSCNGKINLSWSPFINSRHPATEYRVFLSVNGSGAVQHVTVPVSQTEYAITGYQPDAEHCFHVVAATATEEISASNMQCIRSAKEKIPEWTRAESTSPAGGGGITVRGRYDPSTDTRNFALEKMNSASDWQTVEIREGNSETVEFTDIEADTMLVQHYRISAVNNCGRLVSHSPVVRSIVPEIKTEGRAIYLRWNNPFHPSGARYAIMRNSGDGFELIASEVSDTLFTDLYSDFSYQVTAGEIAYYVTAVRDNAPAEATICRSPVILVDAMENIVVANAFTPDGNGLNDTFGPALSFTPPSYDFRIYTRAGLLLFMTTSHGTPWDGSHNGTPMPTGVYLWHLRLTTPSGETVVRNGTVTILP